MEQVGPELNEDTRGQMRRWRIPDELLKLLPAGLVLSLSGVGMSSKNVLHGDS